MSERQRSIYLDDGPLPSPPPEPMVRQETEPGNWSTREVTDTEIIERNSISS